MLRDILWSILSVLRNIYVYLHHTRGAQVSVWPDLMRSTLYTRQSWRFIQGNWWSHLAIACHCAILLSGISVVRGSPMTHPDARNVSVMFYPTCGYFCTGAKLVPWMWAWDWVDQRMSVLSAKRTTWKTKMKHCVPVRRLEFWLRFGFLGCLV